jgi:hypothetical protein
MDFETSIAKLYATEAAQNYRDVIIGCAETGINALV